MRVVLIDDEQIALDVLEFQLLDLEGIVVAGKFTNPMQALAEIEKMEVDVVFLDMEMPQIHGLSFAERLISAASNLEIVFVTAHPQFALEAFEVNAIDYLLKPVIPTRLKKTIYRLQERIQFNEKNKGSGEHLTAYLMGSFRLFNGQDQQIKWRTKKVKELFTYLWVHQKTRKSKERLMEELWPDYPPAKASALMHTTVYQLRKTLKDNGIEDAILSINDQYVLNVRVKTDVSVLEKAMHLSENKYANLERNLQLYSGDFLEEEGYSWAIEKQLVIKRLFLKYLEDFVIAEQEYSANPYLIELSLEKMVQLEPYNEKYLYLILEYFGKAGNNAKMMKHLRSAEKKWREELGLELPIEVTNVYHFYLSEK